MVTSEKYLCATTYWFLMATLQAFVMKMIMHTTLKLCALVLKPTTQFRLFQWITWYVQAVSLITS